ncbi:MAG: hypothetical protein ABR579_05560 [Actinomycetota bacterium]
MTSDPHRELADLLDDVAYELTQARAATLDDLEALRKALKRAQDLVARADALVASFAASLQDESG